MSEDQIPHGRDTEWIERKVKKKNETTIQDVAEDDDIVMFSTSDEDKDEILFSQTPPTEKMSIQPKKTEEEESIQSERWIPRTIKEASIFVIEMMAFFGLKEHPNIQGISIDDGTSDFSNFVHLYCYAKKKEPGFYGNRLSQDFIEKMAIEQKYRYPPRYSTNVFDGSFVLIDFWLAYPNFIINELINLSFIQKCHSKNPTNVIGESNTKEMPSIELAMPMWEPLFQYMRLVSFSDSLRINVRPQRDKPKMDLEQTDSVYDEKEDMNEVYGCYSKEPKTCSVLPQEKNVNGLCLVRYTVPSDDKNEEEESNKSEVIEKRQEDTLITPIEPISKTGEIAKSALAIEPIKKKNIEDFFISNKSIDKQLSKNTTTTTLTIKTPSPYFFISESLTEQIKSMWYCSNLHHLVAKRAFSWYSIYLEEGGKELNIEKAMEQFIDLCGNAITEEWTSYLKCLAIFRASMQKKRKEFTVLSNPGIL